MKRNIDPPVQRPVCPEDPTSINAEYWGLAFLQASTQPMDAMQIVEWFENALRAGFAAGAGEPRQFLGDDDE